MSEWRRVPLGELVDVIDPHPSHRAPDETEYGIPFIGIGDVNEDGTFLEGKGRIVSPKIFDEHAKRYQLTSNTIGFGRVATIGKVIDFQNPTKKVVISPTMALLEPYDKKNREFLLFALQGRDIANQIDRLLTGSTRSSLGIELLRKLEILLPPLDVRRKMSTIFQTVTKQVTQTQSLIDKYTSIKQGMMADLFSRGIDTATGQLRPSFEEAPELYKETELGWVPKEWEVCLLDDLANRGSGHTPNKDHPEYWDGDIQWVSLADSSKLDKLYISETERNITDLGIQNSSAVKHPAGTVILSRDAGVGKSAILTNEMAVSQHFMAWRCGSGLDNLFLYFWLQHNKPVFEAIAMGSTIVTIGLDYFKKLKMACPTDVEEQRLIAMRLLKTHEFLGIEKENHAKLVQIKKGLMQDLLTGKVPVSA